MVLAGNKAERLSSVNCTTKTIHHHHHVVNHNYKKIILKTVIKIVKNVVKKNKASKSRVNFT